MPRNPIALLLLGLIRTYQLTLSLFLGRHCRFAPSCSEYAADAIRKHGSWSGLWLAILRVTDCRPGGGSGFDPVPETLPSVGWKVWRLRRIP